MADSVSETDLIQFMTFGILIMVALALAFIIFFFYSQRKLWQEEMRRQQLELKHQEELLHGTILVQEQERKRIAENLHDDIGSKLNALSLYMNQLVQVQSAAASLLPDMKKIIKATAETTRRISHELLPPTLENFGLVEAIQELCNTYDQSKDLQVQFSVEEDKGRLQDPTVEMNLFRIVQELISNSTRHGKATEISVQLWQGTEKIHLHYRDNGIGFDVAKMQQQKGLGMKNIYSRLNMIKATMEMESEQEGGAQFYVNLRR